MLLVIFVIAAICGIGWFNEWLDKCALYRYWAERYHELPAERVLEEQRKEILCLLFKF